MRIIAIICTLALLAGCTFQPGYTPARASWEQHRLNNRTVWVNEPIDGMNSAPRHSTIIFY